MLSRLGALRTVFGMSAMLRSTGDVIVRTVVRCRKYNEIPISKLKDLFAILGYASKKNNKYGIYRTEVGRKVSVFRRSILLIFLRKAYESYDIAIASNEEDGRRPFWLTWVSREDTQQKVMYFLKGKWNVVTLAASAKRMMSKGRVGVEIFRNESWS